MKKYTLLATLTFLIGNLFSQGIYLVPDPTNVMEPVRLYVNVTSPDCQCSELTDVGPNNPLYLWTWLPVESRGTIQVDGSTIDITNGEWGSSNESMRMTQDENNPNLWYYDFFEVPLTEFYGGSSAADFYSGGIHFLVKEKNGAPPDVPEQKSADLVIVPESPGCVEKFCTFPTVWFPTDYLTITYDNTIEENPFLQNLNPNEVFVWFSYRVNGGSTQTFGNSSTNQILMDDNGGGSYSFTLIPNELFGIEEGNELTSFSVYVTKPPIASPPFAIQVLQIGCPE